MCPKLRRVQGTINDMWYHEHEDGVLLQIKVIANSRINLIVGKYNDFLKIKIAATPEAGKANLKLREFLGKVFGISASSINIVKGQHQPIKLVFLPISPEKLLKGINNQPS